MKYLLIIPILITAIALFMVVKNVKMPSGLGVKDGKLADLPKSPNAVSSFTEDPKKRVEPLQFKTSLSDAKERIKKALLAYGDIEIKSETDNYIYAVSSTSMMRYHDDLEFLFDEKNGVVHFRSASRVGYSDMGMNRKRYDRLAQLFDNN